MFCANRRIVSTGILFTRRAHTQPIVSYRHVARSAARAILAKGAKARAEATQLVRTEQGRVYCTRKAHRSMRGRSTINLVHTTPHPTPCALIVVWKLVCNPLQVEVVCDRPDASLDWESGCFRVGVLSGTQPGAGGACDRASERAVEPRKREHEKRVSSDVLRCAGTRLGPVSGH